MQKIKPNPKALAEAMKHLIPEIKKMEKESSKGA